VRGTQVVETGEVDNRYRTALGRALPGAQTQVDRVAEAFGITRRAMDAGAWSSGVADAFAGTCFSVEAAAGAAADDCVSTMQRRHDREPPTVLPFDRRARWV